MATRTRTRSRAARVGGGRRRRHRLDRAVREGGGDRRVERRRAAEAEAKAREDASSEARWRSSRAWGGDDVRETRIVRWDVWDDDAGAAAAESTAESTAVPPPRRRIRRRRTASSAETAAAAVGGLRRLARGSSDGFVSTIQSAVYGGRGRAGELRRNRGMSILPSRKSRAAKGGSTKKCSAWVCAKYDVTGCKGVHRNKRLKETLRHRGLLERRREP